MKKSKQPDFIFSITSDPAWIEYENENGNGVKLNKEGKGNTHNLDILNWATIKLDNSIKHPEQNFYDNQFIKSINNTKSKVETLRYLNHHYNSTHSPPVFIKKIDDLLERKRNYQIDETFTDVIRNIVLEWYGIEIIKYNKEVSVLSNQKTNYKHSEAEFLIEFISKYRKIKKDFDSIREYSDKLIFWETVLCSKEKIYWNLIPSYLLCEDEIERQKPENHLTIFPEKEIEKELFVNWIFGLIEKDESLRKNSFDNLKNDFKQKISITPLPKEFIQGELKEIESQCEKELKRKENNMPISTWAYYLGFLSTVKAEKIWMQLEPEKFYNLSLSISKGIADANYYSFLKKELSSLDTSKTKENETENTNSLISKEKDKIIKELNAIDKNGWSYAFTSEDDFNTFVELLTNYFQQNEFEIPTETIKLKHKCKTKLAKAFNPIHTNLGHDDKKLKSDFEFFKLIRVLNHFKNLTDSDIYNAITR